MENEEIKNKKDKNIKVVYGKGDLRVLVNDLMEEKMIDTLKKCENQWKIINSHILLKNFKKLKWNSKRLFILGGRENVKNK